MLQSMIWMGELSYTISFLFSMRPFIGLQNCYFFSFHREICIVVHCRRIILRSFAVSFMVSKSLVLLLLDYGFVELSLSIFKNCLFDAYNCPFEIVVRSNSNMMQSVESRVFRNFHIFKTDFSFQIAIIHWDEQFNL